MRHWIPGAIARAVAAFAAGCGGDRELGPPELKLGRDMCKECGMIVSEDRSCSAWLIDIGGSYEAEVFDDVGCMLDRERRGEAGNITARYFHDYPSRAWIVGKEPVFVMSEAIHTPMGSGIVAFADQVAAEAAAKETGGKLYDAVGMAAERRRWMEERYGKPKDR